MFIMKNLTIVGCYILFILMLMSCGKMTPDEVEALIKSDKQFGYLDMVCDELPKPESFKYVGKYVFGNTKTNSLELSFRSPRLIREVRKFYEEEHGYTITDWRYYSNPERFYSKIEFKYKDINIIIDRRPPSAIYGITCQKARK